MVESENLKRNKPWVESVKTNKILAFCQSCQFPDERLPLQWGSTVLPQAICLFVRHALGLAGANASLSPIPPSLHCSPALLSTLSCPPPSRSRAAPPSFRCAPATGIQPPTTVALDNSSESGATYVYRTAWKPFMIVNMARQNYLSTTDDNRPDSACTHAAAARFSVDSFSCFAYSFYCYFSSFSYGSWESGSGRDSRQAM
jgi:hypothetical protein